MDAQRQIEREGVTGPAAIALGRDDGEVRETAQLLRSTARLALDELRDVIGVLRDAEHAAVDVVGDAGQHLGRRRTETLRPVAPHQVGGELAAGDNDDRLAQILQLFDERQKIAVAGNETKRVDVALLHRDFKTVENDADISRVLNQRPENRRFHQFDTLFHQLAAMAMMAIPIAVGASQYDRTARAQSVDH